MATSDSIPQAGPAEQDPPTSYLDVEDTHNLCRSQLDVLLAAFCADGDLPSREAVAFLLMNVIKQSDAIYAEYEKVRPFAHDAMLSPKEV
jgi:hypothetical protein